MGFLSFAIRDLLIILFLGAAAHGAAEDNADKDLYKVLNVSVTATQKTISQAFRKLAKAHHPDKWINKDKVETRNNEALFKEITAAYDILSDVEQRGEYDALRRRRKASNNDTGKGNNNYNSNYDYDYDNVQQHFPYMFEQETDYDDMYQDDIFPHRYRPMVIGPLLPSRQVMLPYSPLLTTADMKYFAVLDANCALGVYSGDVRTLVAHLHVVDTPDLTNLPVELVFRTEGDRSLKGQCFAGLDDSGMFRIYSGHPTTSESANRIIWTSKNENTDNSFMFLSFRQYYLELSDTGDLSIRLVVAGNSESQCVWSTTSCNNYFAILIETRGRVLRLIEAEFGELFGTFRQLPFKNILQIFKESIRKAWDAIISLWNYVI